MASLDHRVSKLTRKMLNRNVMLLDRVRRYEAGQAVLALIKHRNRLDETLESLEVVTGHRSRGYDTEKLDVVCKVMTTYHGILDRLFRLGRIPQAPSGAQSGTPEQRPQLDITPEALPIDTPEVANPGGSPEPDSPI